MELRIHAADLRREERAAVTVDALSPFDRIMATTVNHQYEFVIVSPRHYTVLVRGGALAGFVPACVIGSAPSGEPLKPGTIAVDRRIEVAFENRRLFTSAVQRLEVILAHPRHADAAA